MASRKVKPERESRVVKPTIDSEELFMATLSETWQWQAFTKLTHNWSLTQLRGLEPWYHKPRMYVGILSVCTALQPREALRAKIPPLFQLKYAW